MNVKVATVLTVYGIETLPQIHCGTQQALQGVATVLTVYGIETICRNCCHTLCMLQQYLPFTVLKHRLG